MNVLEPIVVKSARRSLAYRISPTDTNYFVLLFDPEGEQVDSVMVVEVFAVGGKTPPNSHQVAHEFFYVLQGCGVAYCGERVVPIKRGDALLLRPGTEHVIQNTGVGKLYTLTMMAPNEGFAELIRAGRVVELDAEDLSLLGA